MGVGAYRPDVIVTNDDVCQWIDSSDEWIRQRTGIITRHRAPADVSVIDMAEGAAREALQKAGIEASQLGAVIVSTVTHPYATPSAAASLADRLGATPAPAFDISAACAGYCYGIAQGDALVRSGAADYVLVVGAEKLSDVIDNTERTISFLLGDGAGAVVIGPSDTPGIGPSVWGSDGSKWDAIGMTHSMLDIRELALAGKQGGALSDEEAAVTDAAVVADPAPGRPDGLPLGRLGDGQGGPAGAGRRRHPAEDLAAFIPHQANMRIIDEMAKKLQAARDRHDRPGHRRRRQHLRGVHPPGHPPPAAGKPRAQRRAGTADRLRRRTGLRCPGDRASVGAPAFPQLNTFCPASDPAASRTLGLNHFRPRLPASPAAEATTRKGAING